jgi:ADP-ribose pyrophosphatase YjhB (NUDIX family)
MSEVGTEDGAREVIVAGAAIIRDSRLFVARRSRPASVSGFWELPGDELRQGEEEHGAIEREFTTEFGVSVRCVDRILSDRRMNSYRTGADRAADATLRIWRCQLPSESVFDVDFGEPRPNMYDYDESAWISIDELDVVGPWREADRMSAEEIADYYRNDDLWQYAD